MSTIYPVHTSPALSSQGGGEGEMLLRHDLPLPIPWGEGWGEGAFCGAADTRFGGINARFSSDMPRSGRAADALGLSFSKESQLRKVGGTFRLFSHARLDCNGYGRRRPFGCGRRAGGSLGGVASAGHSGPSRSVDVRFSLAPQAARRWLCEAG